VGDRCPLHASALGKAIAAQLPEQELETLLNDDDLPQFTKYTIQSALELRRNLAQTRKRGYAVNNQETVEGAVVFAAPLVIASGQVVGAISVTAPSAKCPAAQRQQIIAQVKRAAASASETLSQIGYRAFLAAPVTSTSIANMEVAP
jgi:IclR family acetate operon transcriptional repressor